MTSTAVPSTDPADLLINVQNVDRFVNDTAPVFIDRLGISHKTMAGHGVDANQAVTAFNADLTAKRLAADAAVLALAAFNPRGAWATGVVYSQSARDVVLQGGIAYLCTVSHTAGTFAADLAAGRWVIHQGATREELSASGGAAAVGFDPGATGGVPRTLQDRARDVRSLRDFGAAIDGATIDNAAWIAAANWSNANKAPVYIPPGRSIYTGGGFAQDYVHFYGAGMPGVSSDNSTLDGGTIVQGSLYFSGRRVTLRNIGVDHGSASFATGADAIKLSATGGEGVCAHLENVIGLGRDSADAFHAILVENFARLTGGNAVGVRNVYAFASKVRESNFGNITGIDNGSRSVIIKCDETFGGTGKSIYGNILAKGTGTTGYGLSILCQNAGATTLQMQHITIGNIQFDGVGNGVAVEVQQSSTGATVVNEISIGRINGIATNNGIYTGVTGGGVIYSMSHGDATIVTGSNGRVANYGAGYVITAGNITGIVPSGSTTINSAVLVSSAVRLWSCGSLRLPVTYSETIFAGAQWDNTPSSNAIGAAGAFNPYGSGAPLRRGLIASAMPTAGRYTSGEFVTNTSPTKTAQSMVLTGWVRKTTGTAHVNGTDWEPAYVSAVSPAV